MRFCFVVKSRAAIDEEKLVIYSQLPHFGCPEKLSSLVSTVLYFATSIQKRFAAERSCLPVEFSIKPGGQLTTMQSSIEFKKRVHEIVNQHQPARATVAHYYSRNIR
jgi:hypothetical protein